MMRRGCNERFAECAVSLVAHQRRLGPGKQEQVRRDAGLRPLSRRALRGMADRWLKVLISMLRHGTLYDPQYSVA